MEPRELFEKVYIKTEKDLPLKLGDYFVKLKSGYGRILHYPFDGDVGYNIFKLEWLQDVEYYLQPVEQEQSNYSQIRDLTDEEWLKLPKEEILQLYKNCYEMLKNYIALSGEKIEDVQTITSTDYSIPQSEIKSAEETEEKITNAYCKTRDEDIKNNLQYRDRDYFQAGYDFAMEGYASQFKIELPIHEEVQNKIYALCSTKQSDGKYLHKATPKILNEFWEWIKQKRGL